MLSAGGGAGPGGGGISGSKPPGIFPWTSGNTTQSQTQPSGTGTW